MTRSALFASFVALTFLAFLGIGTLPATAGPHLLPRIRMPKVNMGKAVGAITYPLKKSAVNGGKTVLNTALTLETGKTLESLAPPSPGGVARKIIVWGVGRH